MRRPASTLTFLAVLGTASLCAGAWFVARAQPAKPASAAAAAAATPPTGPAIKPALPGTPPVPDARNLYSTTGAATMSPAVASALPRIYVPNLRGNDVSVIDPATRQVVDKFKVGRSPQHIVPSWDMKTLWVTNNAEGRKDGSLTPIDPVTGKPGAAIPVDDPYNMYFTPDGKSAIVVAEALKRLDFRDPQTMALQYSISTPGCPGINHAEFSIDGRFALFTCEFSGALAKIDLVDRSVTGYLQLSMPELRLKSVKGAADAVLAETLPPSLTEICTAKKGMPQDIRSSPDGSRFYVADMHADGVHVIDPIAFKKVGFITTGLGAHGLYPSRDGRQLYITNRGAHKVHGGKDGIGSVAVLDFAKNKLVANWPIPDGGSPDMGNVSADGRTLWLSGRYDDEVYAIDTASGKVEKIAVGAEPHGLTVWPQPGRYSLGHTGNMR